MRVGRAVEVGRLVLVDAGVVLVAYAAIRAAAGGAWDPFTSSLSRLGVLPGVNLLFNGGVALAAVGLGLYAYCSLAWLVAAASLSQVAVYTLAHPSAHFAAAAIFFTSVVAELVARGNVWEEVVAAAGYAGIPSGLLLHIPRGIAVPEALVIAAALSYLHRGARCGVLPGQRV